MSNPYRVGPCGRSDPPRGLHPGLICSTPFGVDSDVLRLGAERDHAVQPIDSPVAPMPRGCQPRSTPTTLKASNRTARGANPGDQHDQQTSDVFGVESDILRVGTESDHAVQPIDSPVAAMPRGCQPRSTPTTLKASNRTARGANPGDQHDQQTSDVFGVESDILRVGTESDHAVQPIDSPVAPMPHGCQPRSTPTTLKASNRTARGANPGDQDDQKVSTLNGLNSVPAAQAACHASPVS